MVKPVSPKDITADTTIEEIWLGFADEVLHEIDPESDDYSEAKILFAAGARATFAWLTKAMPNAPPAITYKLIQREVEVGDMIDGFIAKRRAEEAAS